MTKFILFKVYSIHFPNFYDYVLETDTIFSRYSKVFSKFVHSIILVGKGIPRGTYWVSNFLGSLWVCQDAIPAWKCECFFHRDSIVEFDLFFKGISCRYVWVNKAPEILHSRTFRYLKLFAKKSFIKNFT